MYLGIKHEIRLIILLQIFTEIITISQEKLNQKKHKSEIADQNVISFLMSS